MVSYLQQLVVKQIETYLLVSSFDIMFKAFQLFYGETLAIPTKTTPVVTTI